MKVSQEDSAAKPSLILPADEKGQLSLLKEIRTYSGEDYSTKARKCRLRLPQVPCSSVEAISEFYRSKKVVDQKKFKLHWWAHKRGGYSKMGEAFCVSVGRCYSLTALVSFWFGGN